MEEHGCQNAPICYLSLQGHSPCRQEAREASRWELQAMTSQERCFLPESMVSKDHQLSHSGHPELGLEPTKPK